MVSGGTTRQASVARGLAALWADVEIVLVHDAARALTPPAVFQRVIAAIEAGRDGGAPGAARGRHDQARLRDAEVRRRRRSRRVRGGADAAGFPAATSSNAAYRAADREYTDDAALVGAAGHSVVVVDGDPRAFKITTGADLDRARALVAEHTARSRGSRARCPGDSPSVGVGTDVHAFGGDGALWLAGLEWPGEPALSGHSDGDAVAHAIVDALLAAAGLGDIGTHFGTDHPEYAGAHADVFLARTLGLLGEAGWRVGNVSVQVQANRPRLAARRAEAEAVLSAALGGASRVDVGDHDRRAGLHRPRRRRRGIRRRPRHRRSEPQIPRVRNTEYGSGEYSSNGSHCAKPSLS